MSPSTSFRFDSQTAFLTYPRCDVDPDVIVDHLKSIKDIEWARVACEEHEDGQPHRHVICKFVSRLQSRNAERLFDVAGFHPNIQPVRSIAKSLAYVAKDGEFTDYGPVPAGRQEEPDWVDAAGRMSEAEYYMLAKQHRLSFQYAQKFWELGRKHSCEVPEGYEAVIDRECPRLQAQVCPEGTVVVVGPSGVGKTSWAKRVCKKPALWVRHIDVLRSFRPRYHKSIIFDDMSFEQWPVQSQIHLVDQAEESHIHCRYGHAVVPSNTQKIFTANKYPFTIDEHGAIARRLSLIDLFEL